MLVDMEMEMEISHSRRRCARTCSRVLALGRCGIVAVAGAAGLATAEPCAGDPGRTGQAQEAQSIDDVVARALSTTITPGAVVAVVVRDSVAFLRSYGRTGAESATPMAVDAVFQVGPVAELVNALAAALLAHGGQVRLDAPVGRFVPEVPEVLGRATLEQLLTHTGGLAVQAVAPGRGGADDLGAAARQLTRLDRVTDPGIMYSRRRSVFRSRVWFWNAPPGVRTRS
jgi:CubicO group peptidase (beta-lactamase class C family)